MPTRTSSKHSNPSSLLAPLLFALAGQVFLAQPDKSWTLFPGLLFYGLALVFWSRRLPPRIPSLKPFSNRLETFLFILILFLAVGFRLWRIDSLPSGMHVDQGFMGERALLLLREGWNPLFDILTFHASSYLLYFTSTALAGWFQAFGSSYITFHVFYVLFSLAAFPFIYFSFRQFGGQRTALLGLFILAVMRWHVLFSRNGFPTIQVPYYSFVALASWLYWLKTRKPVFLAVSALFCGIGLYTYQAFKAFPLFMLACGLYELFSKKSGVRSRHLFVYFFILMAVAGPLLACAWKESSAGYREGDLFIGKEVQKEKSLVPLLRNWTQTALMFNRSGDSNPRHNIPGHRMLDDMTGLLFILGLARLWSRRRERDGFYPLAGLLIMSLPSLLSIDAAHSNRMLGAAPWVAFTAATTLSALGGWFEKKLNPPFLAPIAIFALLAFMAVQNAYSYFVTQAGDERCWKANGIEQTFIGKTIRDLEQATPGGLHYFITPAYFGNHTVNFLADGIPKDISELNVSGLGRGEIPRDKDAIFVLEEDQSGGFEYLKTLFPGGGEKSLTDSSGHVLVYLYAVPREKLLAFHGWQKGLKGTYMPQDGKTPPLTRVDPLLNFSYWKEFPLNPLSSFSIQWEGRIELSSSGLYQFQVLTNHGAKLMIDGRLVLESTSEKPASLNLLKGFHRIQVTYQKLDKTPPVFHLVWKVPGKENWEVVPAATFGKAPL